MKLLTEDVEALTGGKIALGDDPVEVAQAMEKHSTGKGQELGLKWPPEHDWMDLPGKSARMVCGRSWHVPLGALRT